MNITDILKNEEMSNEDKLTNIVDVVSKVRKSYGNEDMAITIPDLNTVEGLVSLSHLSVENKLACVKREVDEIKVAAIEYYNNHEGVNINKVIEEAIATSALLTNLGEVQTFDYI